MNDIQLSPHFKLSEFTKSATADQRHINNTLDPTTPADAEIIDNLRNLCVKLLEPLRTFVNRDAKSSLRACPKFVEGSSFEIPIEISSGYRCPSLNRAVGGAANSQHMKGEAADLRIPTKKAPNGSAIQDMPTARKWIEWLLDQRFDQLILEHDRTGHYWIHLSLNRNDSQNRQVYISNLLK